MSNQTLPDLTFPTLRFGRDETPWDLRSLLYPGAAALLVRECAARLASGGFGAYDPGRLDLVVKLHDELTGHLAGGGSRRTAANRITALRTFFSWADAQDRAMTLATVAARFNEWCRDMFERARTQALTEQSAYQKAMVVAVLLDRVLERRASILLQTPLRKPRATTKTSDKQSLQETAAFGQMLLVICKGLTLDVIRGPLPVRLTFGDGGSVELWSGWTGKRPLETLKPANPQAVQTKGQRFAAKVSRQLRAAWEADTSLRTRSPLVNLRIEAEMLVFIAQTGFNLAQAQALRMDQFHYTSHLDGYQVRSYKSRRGGPVLFEIFSEYKELFEQYLGWRRELFPDPQETLLFPLVRTGGSRELTQEGFKRVRSLCRERKQRFVSPRTMRKTRLNWLRRAMRDDTLTAEMGQHATETFLRVYDEPNHQVAMIEIARFHARTDPTIAPPGPGVCVAAAPQPVPDIPPEATRPDCSEPTGCLFCIHQRDIDSDDHVWSLCSFRHLKTLEQARYRPPANKRDVPQPAVAAINRINAKLKYFHDSSETRATWVTEAQQRVAEGDYHPAWDGFVQLAESMR